MNVKKKNVSERKESDTMGYYRNKRRDILNDFISSDENILLLEWKTMGYSCPRSLYTSFSAVIIDYDYNCNCDILMLDGNVFLVKKNCIIPKDLSKVKVYDKKVARPRDIVKSAIIDFLRSNEDVREIPWEELGYGLAVCAYNSYRTSIKRYKYDDMVKVSRVDDRVSLVRL